MRYNRPDAREVFALSLGKWLAAFVILALATRANAERIALEAYVGERPPEAQPVMSTLRRVLARDAKYGWVFDPTELAKRFATHRWLPGGSKAVAADIARLSEAGRNSFLEAVTDAHLDKAEKMLRQAVDLARANTVAWVDELRYRESVQRALLFYALTRAKQNERLADKIASASPSARSKLAKEAERAASDRDSTIAELIRTFPTAVVSAKEYGVDAETLFQRVRKDLDKQGRGSLEIKASNPDIVVHIGERVPDHRKPVGDLVAGIHRVLVVESPTRSRVYEVPIYPNKTSRLIINSDLDAVLVLDASWAGFKYPAPEAQAREAEYIVDLVGRETNAAIATVFTVERSGKTTFVTGTLYSAKNGKIARSCRAEVARFDDESVMSGLLDCMLNGSQAKAVVLLQRAQSELPANAIVSAETAIKTPLAAASNDSEAEPAPLPGNRRWMKWTAIGAFGVGAVGGGLALKFALDANNADAELQRTCSVTCTPEQYRTLADRFDAANRKAIISGVVGGAAVLTGAVFIVLSMRSGSPQAVSIVPTPTGGVAAYTFVF